MALDTAVNSQITDVVTQTNTDPCAPPARSLGNLYQSLAQATGIALQNAVTAQNDANAILNAATTQGVALLYSVPKT